MMTKIKATINPDSSSINRYVLLGINWPFPLNGNLLIRCHVDIDAVNQGRSAPLRILFFGLSNAVRVGGFDMGLTSDVCNLRVKHRVKVVRTPTT